MAVYRLQSIPMVVFVERIAVLKSLSQPDDSDTNVIDRYQHRPRELQSMYLAEVAAKYV